MDDNKRGKVQLFKCLELCVQSMCAVCHNPQYMLMCTVDVCSVLQSTVHAGVYSRCVLCVTIHSTADVFFARCLTMKCLPNTVNFVPFKR